MKKGTLLTIFFILLCTSSFSQAAYDSITSSRFLIRSDSYTARWKDSLNAGSFQNYLSTQKKIWVKPVAAQKSLPKLFSLFNRIKINGTEDVSECFIPRHSINFYKAGKIVRYLLVCFECEGLRFSDDPVKKFVKSIIAREKQMTELKAICKDFL